MVCKTCLVTTVRKDKKLKILFALLAAELAYAYSFNQISLENLLFGIGATAGGALLTNTTSITTGILVMAHTTTISDYAQAISSAVASSEATGYGILQSNTSSDGIQSLAGPVNKTIEKIVNTSSLLYNKNFKKIILKLHKTGLPTGTATIAIWNSADTLVFTFGTLDVATLTTTPTEYSFENLTGYTTASGDKIGITFSGGTWSSDVLEIARASTNVYDGTNSIKATYNAGWTDDTTQDLWFKLWGDGATTSATYIKDNDTNSFLKTNSEIGAWCYIDLGANANAAAIALWSHADTTATQIKIRGSTDTTFTDSENVRIINVTALTHGQYNYIRFNIKTVRYLQFFVTDAIAKVLSINEIKVYTVTDAVINANHGHLLIDATSTTIGLDGT